MSQSQQEKLHRQKWKIWNQQRQREQIKKKMNVEEGIQNYAANLIQKINNPFEKHNEKQNKNFTKQLSNEIQSNVCSICLELMIPPDRHPMILFPCGHNLCKDCLFEHPPKGLIKKGLVLRLKKCTLCRNTIQSYALNQSLMTLICTYSNNKELLEKEQQRIQQEQQKKDVVDQDIQQLKIRCKILEGEQKNIHKETQKFAKQKQILGQVIETLKKEKKQNEKQMERIQQEAKLINKCLTQKLQDMQLVQKKLKQSQDKERVVQKALAPLKREKQKQEMLEIARLVSKK